MASFRLRPLEVHVHADRRLAFQVLTAFGAGNSPFPSREGDHLLVEFHTPARDLLGRRRTYRTGERVFLYEPERVEFEAVESPLAGEALERLPSHYSFWFAWSHFHPDTDLYQGEP